MAKIRFNQNFGIDMPTLVLERRDFSKIGILSDISDVEYRETLQAPELSFTVRKTEPSIWEHINNYNLVFIPEYREHFSLHVDTSEETCVTKTVTATYLPVSELQEIKLRNLEINTEADIAREDYDADYPTVFYRDLSGYAEGSPMYQKLRSASLLHRILDKASNYEIGHIDRSLQELKLWFQYSISDSSVYDMLTGEIAADYQCLFTFDSDTRTINVYDLCNTCGSCGYRGDFHDTCPECGTKLDAAASTGGAYGSDTTIYISGNNLASASSVASNKDNLKNCLYVVGGDDLMTAAVAMVNPSGSNYLLQFSDEMYENMPSDLSETLKKYNRKYQYCMNEKVFSLTPSLVSQYNETVRYINEFYPARSDNGTPINRYQPIGSAPGDCALTGYKNISSLCFDCIDIALTLQSSMGKTQQMDSLSMGDTMALLCESRLSPVAVKSDVSSVAESVVTNTVLGACKSLIHTGLYKVDAVETSYSKTSHVWTGKFKLTNIEDKTVSLIGPQVSVTVNNDMETYLKQNIQRNLNKLDTNYKDLRKQDLSDSEFKEQLQFYSLDFLGGLKNSYGDVLAIVLDSGNAELRNKYCAQYADRIGWIEAEMAKRQAQIDAVKQLYDYETPSGEICVIQDSLRDELNLETWLDEPMWKVFCSYRMEDTYQNSNFISDGLDNAALVSRANELLLMAKRELQKISNVQYTVTATINNLLALPEFQPLFDQFEVGSWIHVCVDEKIYYLRLLSYKLFFDDISKMEVEFSTVEKVWSGISDVDSVLQSAQSVASSYSYTTQKVKNTAKTSQYIENWVRKGLDATATKIVNNAENQNIVYDSTGLLCRTYDDLTDAYDLCQSRFINSGLYVTDNNWESVKAAVGKYSYTDPNTGEEKTTMGVIADTIIGEFILGENLWIRNENGLLEFTKEGFHITNGEEGDKMVSFVVNPDEEKLLRITKGGGGSAKDLFYTDKDGNVYFAGNLSSPGGKIGGFTIKSNALYNGTDSVTSTAAGVYLGTDGLRQYQSPSSYTQIQNGKLTCMGADIKGNIYLNNDLMMWHGDDISDYGARYEKALSWELLSEAYILRLGGAAAVTSYFHIEKDAYIRSNASVGGNINGMGNLSVQGNTNLNTATVTDTLVLSKTTDASGTENKSPALIVGGTAAQVHMELDNNEIQGKSDGTTPNGISINKDGGNVYIGKNTADYECTVRLPATFIRSIQAEDGLSIQNNKWITTDFIISSTPDGDYNNVVSREARLLGMSDKNQIHIGDPDTRNESPVYLHAKGASYGFLQTTFRPDATGTQNLGDSSHPWNNVYAKNGAINTSDRNQKKEITDIGEIYEKLFLMIRPKTFLFNDGDRIHIGAVSQDIEEAMQTLGIAPEQFAGFCKDIVYRYTEYSEDGTPVEESKVPETNPDGSVKYAYSLRYQEFIMLTVHMVQKLIAKEEENAERLLLLEKQLSRMQNKPNA